MPDEIQPLKEDLKKASTETKPLGTKIPDRVILSSLTMEVRNASQGKISKEDKTQRDTK